MGTVNPIEFSDLLKKEADQVVKKTTIKELFSANRKLNKIIFIITAYTLIILGLILVSNLIENGKTCFSTNPYWKYGPITLSCYFFDTAYKFLLYPSYIFIMFIYNFFISSTKNIDNNLFFMICLFMNDLILYFLLNKFVDQKKNTV